MEGTASGGNAMSRARPAAVLALVALLLFVATALWTQFARSDLDIDGICCIEGS